MVDNNYNSGYNVTVTNCNNFVTIGKFVTQIGGNIMIKPSKAWLAICLSASMLVSTVCTYVSEAKETVYNDSNVSITSAIDRYIAINGVKVEEEEPVESVATPIDAQVATTSDAMKKDTKAVETAETTTSSTPITVADNIYDGKAIVVANSYVNIRQSSSTDSAVVGTISNNGLVVVEEKGEEWSLVSSGSCKGYIKNEFMLFGSDAKAYAEANLSKVVEITTASLRVRTEGSEESEIITSVSQGSKYDILELGAEWTKIQVDSYTSGYVKNDYICVTYNTVYADPVKSQPESNSGSTGSTEAPSAPVDVPTSATGDSVASYAVQFVGNPYVYGGTSLTEGADCSGFVMRIYADFGYSIPRTADVQATAGTEVSLSALYPGDLVFYDHGTGSIDHVALYIGNNQVVHASTSRTGIIISDINYNTPCKAVRIIY